MDYTVEVPFIGGGLDGQTMGVVKPLLGTMRDIEGTMYRLMWKWEGERGASRLFPVYMEESQAYQALKDAEKRD